MSLENANPATGDGGARGTFQNSNSPNFSVPLHRLQVLTLRADLAGAPLRRGHFRRPLSEHLARAMARRAAYRCLEDDLLAGIPLPPMPQVEAALNRLEDRDWQDYYDLAGACVETIARLFARARERREMKVRS